jgi:hypothetical protein
LFADNPDVMLMTAEGNVSGLIRTSNPSPNDPPCTRANPFRVKAHYAWLRGATALKQKDESTARCWLTVSSDAGLAAGQSLLASLLTNATPPDYAAAFALATASAKQGDITGELELAQLYREGKGTPPDAAKAQYWRPKPSTRSRPRSGANSAPRKLPPTGQVCFSGWLSSSTWTINRRPMTQRVSSTSRTIPLILALVGPLIAGNDGT